MDISHIPQEERRLAIQRLTALWALNECGLGGILHAFNSPFTGLLVGSMAMMCIALICSMTDRKWSTVMTSLLIVLIIKALVSPHSTPTAYVAVIFQGVTGALIYRMIPSVLIASVMFFSLGLIESAVQRLLMLTLLYGNTLWEAIDLWGSWVADRWGMILPISSSRLIINIYLCIHLAAGLLMGWVAMRTIKSVLANWGQAASRLMLTRHDRKEFVKSGSKKGKRMKRWILFFVLILMIALAYFLNPGKDQAWQKTGVTLLRVAAILTLWFVFLAPLLVQWIQSFLKKKHERLAAEVSATMDMFPHILWILDKAWKETKEQGIIRRWKAFMVLTIVYVLQYQTSYDTDSDRTDT